MKKFPPHPLGARLTELENVAGVQTKFTRRTALGAIAFLGPTSAIHGWVPVGMRSAYSPMELSERKTLEDFGADPTGATSSHLALAAALASSKTVHGVYGSTYSFTKRVDVPGGSRLFGEGATIRFAPGVIGWRTVGDDVRYSNWKVDTNGALYAFQSIGRNYVEYDTLDFKGDVGHYIFDNFGTRIRLTQCNADGREIDRIGTCFVLEGTDGFQVDNCSAVNTENWFLQTRGAKNGVITAPHSHQMTYTKSVISMSGQRVFNFVLDTPCHLAGVQVDGVPVDTGITLNPPLAPELVPTVHWQVTTAVGLPAGSEVKLIAHRSAENIQINDKSENIDIIDPRLEGSGDSVLVIAGKSRNIKVMGGSLKMSAYSSLSIEGECYNIDLDGITCADPSLVNRLATYSSFILIGGRKVTSRNHKFISSAPVTCPLYGHVVNVYGESRGQMEVDTLIGQTQYDIAGAPLAHTVYVTNQDIANRRQSIEIEGMPRRNYPATIDLDGPWTGPNPTAPVRTELINYTGVGKTFVKRDTIIKLGGIASLRTVPGEYLDIELRDMMQFANCLVDILFWAKNDNGSSFMQARLNIGGSYAGSPRAEITATEWKQYRLNFALTPAINIDATRIRIGSDTGSANIQHIQISAVQIT